MHGNRRFQPGFRLSVTDLVVMVVGASGAFLLSRIDSNLAFVVGFVVVHFFLFCNVFRLSRPPELIWATSFTLSAAATITLSWPGWTTTFVGAAALSALLIAREMGKPHYHGIWWRRLNPTLESWWDARSDHRL